MNEPSMIDTLAALAEVLEHRKKANPEESYVASLYSKGLDKILQKVGEESTETILAAKNGEKQQIIAETADLWFHTLVMLSHQNIHPSAVIEELQKRFGISGHEEKASR